MIKATLKDDAGPWNSISHLFPDGIPLKSFNPILAGRNNLYSFEIDEKALNEPQLEALALAVMWQEENNQLINFERACKRRFLVSKHWTHIVSGDFDS